MEVSAYLQGSGLGANLGSRLHLPTSSPTSSSSNAGSDIHPGRGAPDTSGGGGRGEEFSPPVISSSSTSIIAATLSAVEPGLPRSNFLLLPTICEDDKPGKVSQAGGHGSCETEPGEGNSAVGGVIPGDKLGSAEPGRGNPHSSLRRVQHKTVT